MILWIVILLAGTKINVWAADTTPLEGNWIRVVDGCEDLSADDVQALNQTGGGNQMSRAEKLTIKGGSYISQMFTPSRCTPGTKARGPKIQPAEKECNSGRTEGSFNLIGESRFEVRAARVSGNNPWGYIYTDFDFKLFDNDVLYVRLVLPDKTCGPALKRIYFIREPVT